MQRGFAKPHPSSATQDPGTKQWLWSVKRTNVWHLPWLGPAHPGSTAENTEVGKHGCAAVMPEHGPAFRKTQGLHGGGEERWGEPSLKRKQRRPSAFSLSHILPFWPCTASLRNFARSSLILIPLLLHIKQLNGWKQGQRAAGTKKKETPPKKPKKNPSAWALLIASPASDGRVRSLCCCSSSVQL